MSSDTLVTLGFMVVSGMLGVIWWEIRGLRVHYHKQANHITVLYGRVGVLANHLKIRFGALENDE